MAKKPQALDARVAKVAKSVLAMKGDLADLLERALVRVPARMKPATPEAIIQDWKQRCAERQAKEAEAKPRKMRRSRRVGFRRYKATNWGQLQLSRVRSGTFRKYMVTTILAHDNTSAATAAHLASGEYQHETLNFKWAADNGYIEFI